MRVYKGIGSNTKVRTELQKTTDTQQLLPSEIKTNDEIRRRRRRLGIHYRGVQWEGGAVDWGSIT